jgi:hypothetical protein
MCDALRVRQAHEGFAAGVVDLNTLWVRWNSDCPSDCAACRLDDRQSAGAAGNRDPVGVRDDSQIFHVVAKRKSKPTNVRELASYIDANKAVPPDATTNSFRSGQMGRTLRLPPCNRV